MPSNSTALITGASSGIGEELARIHASHKGNLVLVARRKERLDRLCAELLQQHGIEARAIEQDLAQPQAADHIHKQIHEWDIQIDYLINNAGFGGMGKFHEREAVADQAMIDVNIRALMELTRLIIPDMLQRSSGRILNVASTAGLVPGGPNQAVYGATKAFIVSLSKAIAQELRGTGITVTALCPGATHTGFAKAAGTEQTKVFKTAADVNRVAKDGYKAMMQGKLVKVTGLTLTQRILFKLMPIIPDRLLLREIEKYQSE